MKIMTRKSTTSAFSLVEVVLAIGVLSLAIVALLGLFGPTIGSVKQVIDTNLATAAVSRVNAEIQRGMTWSDAQTATEAHTVYFVWKSQDDLGDPTEFNMSSSSSELATDLDNGRLVDTPMAVTFQEGMQTGDNQYTWGNIDNEGYFPILINIYPIEPSQAGSYTYDSLKNNIDPIFTYTTAKTRSL